MPNVGELEALRRRAEGAVGGGAGGGRRRAVTSDSGGQCASRLAELRAPLPNMGPRLH